MKKILLGLSLAGLLLTSCESNNNFLEEDLRGHRVPENYFNTIEELQSADAGLRYLFMRTIQMPYESCEFIDIAGDDIFGSRARNDFKDWEVNASPTTSAIQICTTAGWESYWNAVNSANGIIQNCDEGGEKRQTLLSTGLSEEMINAYVATAKIVRAYTYFQMVTQFNQVPLVTSWYAPDVKKEQRLSPAKDIYEKVIIPDLQYAEKWLPLNSKEVSKFFNYTPNMAKGGAFTQGAAKSLLAKVYLQEAGFPVKAEGAYAKAAAKAKEVMDNADTYGYGLENHYWEAHDPYWCFKPLKDKEEKVMWFQVDGDRECTTRGPLGCRPNSGFGGWNLFVAEIGFFTLFPEGERKDYTFVTEFHTKDKMATITGQDSKNFKWFEGENIHPMYRKTWACPLNNVKKCKICGELHPNGWDWTKRNEEGNLWHDHMEAYADWETAYPDVIMRYAEVLLIYAEAQARSEGTPNTLAYKCLNDIRNRAYKGLGTTEASVSGLSTDDFITAVVNERAFEFAGTERGLRFYDLQRLEMIEQASKYNGLKFPSRMEEKIFEAAKEAWGDMTTPDGDMLRLAMAFQKGDMSLKTKYFPIELYCILIDVKDRGPLAQYMPDMTAMQKLVRDNIESELTIRNPYSKKTRYFFRIPPKDEMFNSDLGDNLSDISD